MVGEYVNAAPLVGGRSVITLCLIDSLTAETADLALSAISQRLYQGEGHTLLEFLKEMSFDVEPVLATA
jgi:hypothetical protein